MKAGQATLGLATILSGLSAGFFFAYQASVTRGLAEVDDSAYVSTFQAINRTVINPWFGVVFIGALIAIAAALFTSMGAGKRAQLLIAAAGALYLVGAFITGAGNVPLNDSLAGSTNPAPAVAAQAREDFETQWNQFNLARTIAFVGAFGCLVFASSLARRQQPA